MTLYHGSFLTIESPNVTVGRTRVDFVKGFYLTAEQAIGQLAYKRINHQIAILNQRIVDECLRFVSSEEVPNA